MILPRAILGNHRKQQNLRKPKRKPWGSGKRRERDREGKSQGEQLGFCQSPCLLRTSCPQTTASLRNEGVNRKIRERLSEKPCFLLRRIFDLWIKTFSTSRIFHNLKKGGFYKSASNLTEEVPKHRGLLFFSWIIVYNLKKKKLRQIIKIKRFFFKRWQKKDFIVTTKKTVEKCWAECELRQLKNGFSDWLSFVLNRKPARTASSLPAVRCAGPLREAVQRGHTLHRQTDSAAEVKSPVLQAISELSWEKKGPARKYSFRRRQESA